MRIPRTLAIILAGGQGSRLGALTQNRVKPALPVGGTYRLIDISLSNLHHSHISDVWIVEQYLPHSLNEYLAQGRPWDLDRNHGRLQFLTPFEGGHGEGFAHGNSDSLWRQRHRIAEFDADLVLVLSADHLYTCNFLDVIDTHLDLGADLTLVTTQVDERPSRYGVVQVTDNGIVTGFDYKPDDPRGQIVSAEIFCYSADVLLSALDELHESLGELGDYGDDLIPHFVAASSRTACPATGWTWALCSPIGRPTSSSSTAQEPRSTTRHGRSSPPSLNFPRPASKGRRPCTAPWCRPGPRCVGR